MDTASRRGILVAALVLAIGVTACIVRSGGPPPGQPVYVQKHQKVKVQKQKHKKHKGPGHDD